MCVKPSEFLYSVKGQKRRDRCVSERGIFVRESVLREVYEYEGDSE